MFSGSPSIRVYVCVHVIIYLRTACENFTITFLDKDKLTGF